MLGALGEVSGRIALGIAGINATGICVSFIFSLCYYLPSQRARWCWALGKVERMNLAL